MRGLVCLLLAAGVAAPAPGQPAAEPAPRDLVVFATASLRRPFEALAQRYQQDHPGARVALRCEGGAQLLEAMYAGEKADVLAIADSSLMARFTSAGITAVGGPTELARSRIAIAVAPGNPKQVKSLADLARADVRLALGRRAASIGRHGRWVLSRQKLEPRPTLEADTAADVLAAVADGAADAGIVYITSFGDAPGRAERVDVPEEQNTPVLYSISVTREARAPQGAAAFVALALGPDGQEILREAGFLPAGAKLKAPDGRLVVP
jgi:molybdate transport system substrate-binding protein